MQTVTLIEIILLCCFMDTLIPAVLGNKNIIGLEIGQTFWNSTVRLYNMKYRTLPEELQGFLYI